MKLIQLGGANDALCHFMNFGGYELLLDCGVSLLPRTSDAAAFCIRLPSLSAVDVASLDFVLLSNHSSMLALPFLTQHLGFKGKVYATEMAMRFGQMLLQELSSYARQSSIVFELSPPTAVSSTSAPSRSAPPASTVLPPLCLDDVARSMKRISIVEYKEITTLSYGVTLTALSSGFSLGSSVWLLESPSGRVAYVAAASGDLNRHPKELDFAPLIDCDTLIVTDIKPDRDPHATTELTIERLLTAVRRVTDRGGVCILPIAFAGVLFDLIEAVYAALSHTKPTQRPIVLLSPFAENALDMAECGAEFLCEKKTEKMYTSEPAFAHERLRASNVLQVATELSSQVISSLQNGGVVFVSHPSLRLGLSTDLIRLFGHDSRHAVVLTDPSIDPHSVLSPLYALEMEKMVFPMDARLSCGDVNQFIARCAPRTLIVPHEYLTNVSASSSNNSSVQPEQDQAESSHFSRVFLLQELIAARPKTELETVAMRRLVPITLDKANKYIDGKLDPELAATAMMTDVNGKGVACIRGKIGVQQHAFVIQSASASGNGVTTRDSDPGPSAATLQTTGDGKGARVTGVKRKTPPPLSGGPTMSPVGGAAAICPSSLIEYSEKSSVLLGQVDETKLLQQLRAHDDQLVVYPSQGPANADTMLHIPALDARVTLWKDGAKTLIESSRDDSRALLRSLVLAQLHELL